MLQTIHAAAEAIRTGTHTPVDLLDQCLARIDQLEEKVRAWVFVDRDRAREEAERLTAELKRGQHRGPLHGIPVGVKDVFDVFDWPTAAGSKLWANSIARRDCTVVERLRQAGAVLVGKTVTTAYASFDPPVTRNPWDLTRTPGGSSSGSAAAVACGMCLGALGTQTGGSITRPASFCGVCGLKPTHGRVSVDGVVPLAPSMDHVGVIAGCVRDLAIMFQAIAGPDDRNSSATAMGQPTPDCLHLIEKRLDPDNKERLPRLGRLRGMFDEMAEPVMREGMDRLSRALKLFLEEGFVADIVPPAGFAEVLAHHRTLMAVEAAVYHEFRLRRHPEDYPPRIRGLIQEGLACPAPDYRRSRVERDALEIACDEMIRSSTVLLPATLGPAPDADTTGDPAFNSPWSFTGLPSVSLPFAWTEDGLPLAVQLVSRRWLEGHLLAAAAWLERLIEQQGMFPRREVRL